MSRIDKIVSGLAWSFGSQFSQVAINLIVSIVLARVMMPAEFGLIGMIAVFVAVGESLMGGGMAHSLIRTENPDEEDYSTVFFMNLGVSILLYGLLFLTAPLIARFFHQPILTPVVRVYTICIIVFAFSGVQSTKLVKEMNFKLVTFCQLPSLIISGIIGIVMAYRGDGVWSLVAMHLSRAILYALLTWFSSDWSPKFVFSKVKLRTHFNFGYKLLLSNILDRIYQNVYNLVIGRFFSATQVGYYTRASTLVQVPVQGVAEPLNAVTYPALATMQNDNTRLQVSYKKLIQQSLFLVVPILTMMIITAEPLFRVLLTDKWLPAVPYFRILCVAGMLNTVNGYNLNILLVKGRSDLFLKLQIVEKVFITIGVLTTSYFGMYGLLYFQLASTVVMFLINSSVGGKLINYSGKDQVLDIYHIFPVALLAGAAGYVLNAFMLGQSIGRWEDIIRIGAVCTCFTVFFLGLCVVWKLQEIRDFKELIINRLILKRV
jgi:O-antigen/teichoic acid export membrane protein